MALSVLKMKDGKYVTVKSINNRLTLCAIEIQEEEKHAPPVKIEIQENQMALRFQYNKEYYILKVVGKTLTLEKAGGDKNPESHWFVKENLGAGEHYGLRSVVEPRQYLSVSKQQRQFIFNLRETPQDCVQVIDKEIA